MSANVFLMGVVSPVRELTAAVAVALAVTAAPAAAADTGDVAALQVALRARGVYAGERGRGRGPRDDSGRARRPAGRPGSRSTAVAGPATRRALGWRGRPALGAPGGDAGHARLGRRGRPRPYSPARASPPVSFDGGLAARTSRPRSRAFRRGPAWAADGVAGPGDGGRAWTARRPGRRCASAAPVAAAAGDGFGPRGDRFHTGIDFPAATGTPVAAAGAGCVTFAGFEATATGSSSVLAHSGGVTTWYAHLSAHRRSGRGRASPPARGVGAVGATGHATGPHLHFEVRVRGAAVDPRTALG